MVIAESTRRLLGGAFELKPLGPQALKGFEAPVPAWTVVREAENVSRFEASRSQGLTPFVGREHEAALLLGRWRGAAEGEGQVVLVVWRSRHRQVAHRGDAARADRQRGACDRALSMLATPRQRRLPPDHKPDVACRRLRRRRAGGRAARQAGGDDRAFEIGGGRKRALARFASVDPLGGAISRARHGPERTEGANDRGAHGVVRGTDKGRPRSGAIGGRALDRPDVARRVRPTGRAPARFTRALGRHRPARIRRALGGPRACRLAVSQSFRAPACAGDGRSRRRRQGAAGRGAWKRSSPRPTACRCSWRN